MHQNQHTENTYLELKFDRRRQRVKECPCGKSNRDGKFVPYIGYENKGYCHSCEEIFLPALPNREDWNKPIPRRTQIIKPVSFIESGILKKTLSNYRNNHFALYLESVFGKEISSQLLEKYWVGTSKKWQGASVFWQVDLQHKIRTGKIMLYSPTKGKRIKEPFTYFSYAHTALGLSDFNLKQCFFGEHLLKGNTKPVAIAESEKTAILASQYLPQFIWLASGGSSGLTLEKCTALKGRNVCLYPDLSKPDAKTNCYESWCKKAKEFSQFLPATVFQVSTLLEINATEKERHQGLDLADYLLRFHYKNFYQREKPKPKATAKSKISIQSVPSFASKTISQVDLNSFEKLKKKFPLIDTLTKRLELEVNNISPYNHS